MDAVVAGLMRDARQFGGRSFHCREVYEAQIQGIDSPGGQKTDRCVTGCGVCRLLGEETSSYTLLRDPAICHYFSLMLMAVISLH